MACLLAITPSQEPVAPGYPERDILSPFRNPTDLYAPPDELFRLLRVMRNMARRSDLTKSFDDSGRETVNDPLWQTTRDKVETIGLDAGHLAQMMRLHRNAEERSLAFYGAFYCTNIDYVFNLISHIPGEPERRTREESLPRAAAFVRAHLDRKFGDLSDDRKQALLDALPEPGSPMAKAQGLARTPIDSDYMHTLRLIPFFQLMDGDDPVDQAQAMWFLQEVFRIRRDLAAAWFEPMLPRVRQLLLSDSPAVQAEAIAVMRSIGPASLREAPKGGDALLEWAKEAANELFPPIRNFNDTIVQLHPSPERDAIVKAGVAALENSSIGDPYRGQRKDGSWYRGFRIGYVPDELQALAIPKDAVITSVNGVTVGTAKELLQAVEQQLKLRSHPRRLFVEYVKDEQAHAVEYRVM